MTSLEYLRSWVGQKYKPCDLLFGVDLNKARKKPHYPMVTIEVSNWLSGAKSFISLDARSEYWQLTVDD